MKDKVIYRKYKNGDIVAVFPYMIWHGSFVTCFDGCGHGGCDYWHIIKQTKPANPEEYKYRNRLLFNYYGYDTQPIKKYNHKKFLEAYNKQKSK
jgi:hypothetical protein